LEQQGTLQHIQAMFENGELTVQQMEDLIERQLGQQKIFAFGSYDEFFSQYFQRNLVAVEDLNRVHTLVQARRKYAKRGRF